MSFAFDTLAYVRRLRDAKVPPEQAEAMAEALAETFNAPAGIATKADLAALENRLLLKLGAFIIVVAGLTLTIARILPQ
jgi:hypothetical protein